MAQQAGSYDFKAAKAAHDEAAQVATNYIFKSTGHDAWVCDEDAGPDMSTGEAYGPDAAKPTTGWRIGSVFELVKQGVSWFKLWVDNVAKLRLGREDSGHVVLDDSGMEVFDYDSTAQDAVSVAEFGKNGARIGKAYDDQATDNESHMELDYHSMQLVDKEGTTYFYASDLRDRQGLATLTAYFVGNGSTREFYVGTNVYDVVSVTVGGVARSDFSFYQAYIILETAPVDGASIVMEFRCYRENAKAYTLGIRRNGGKIGPMSYAEGYYIEATGENSHAEGDGTTASGRDSHSEGSGSTASGNISHAEGLSTTASGYISHAEGSTTVAQAHSSHAEGNLTDASGISSHAQNYGTIAASSYQTALGSYNVEDANGTYAVIVGNGTSDDDRSNALAVDWNGNVEMGPRLTLDADSNNAGALRFQSENRLGEFIKLYGGSDEYGDAVVIGDGGCVVIGSGESAINVYDAESMAPGTEIMAITSDTHIDLYSNCNTIANRCKFRLANAGDMQVLPMKYDMSLADNGASQSWWGGASSTSTFWPGYRVLDRSGRVSSFFGSSIAASGAVSSGMWVYNYNTSGAQVANASFAMHMSKSGSVSYSVPSPDAFRNAIGTHAYGRLVGMSSNMTLATSAAKVPFANFGGSGCSASANGIKVARAGTYMVWATAYMTSGYTDNDIIHFGIYKNSTQMYHNQERTTNAAPYKTVHIGPTFFDLAANDVVYLYAYNQASARGVIGNMAMNGLYLRQIA